MLWRDTTFRYIYSQRFDRRVVDRLSNIIQYNTVGRFCTSISVIVDCLHNGFALDLGLQALEVFGGMLAVKVSLNTSQPCKHVGTKEARVSVEKLKFFFMSVHTFYLLQKPIARGSSEAKLVENFNKHYHRASE